MFDLFHWFDLLGVAVFAISGTLLAHEKSMDGFGVIVLAAVTAIGGGTLRDVILDLPVFWVHDTSYFITILLTVFVTIIWLNYKPNFPHYLLQLADALGIAFFAIMGAQKALESGVPAMTAIIMGVLTGCFGGMIRDVLAREVPMLLKGPLYAVACLFGASVYIGLMSLGVANQHAMWIGGLTTLVVRLIALKWNISVHVFRYPS
ncbi:trimeric intracellular cation channel family protein [Pseudoalteromonas sp. SSDWG2]|uniref:trimeric intracellular cation channel family protein n=1 Tax=Pseudoalteromonas sp. SSDWG2 TaxID=3139391 RepID=UPI003BAA23B2